MVTFDFVKTPITKIVDAIITNASQLGSSDIHFDPRDDGLTVRTRVDGDLMDYTFIPKVYERNLTTRLKLMAGMNITESRLPQDGAIKGKFGEEDLDMRVSSLPTNEGEKIVIRILDYSRSLSGIDQLGFNNENFIKLKNMISAPNGIILVTGATGSGKSTTTYSILQVLNKERTNIITVEDPIEMNIEGLNQVQVNSEIGLDFATVLRSILRQDPNVILIGEIRDSETAKIAVRASITGHLVLSTLHTNNSLSTIERLLDMDVERYLLSTALTGIISQRLAKTLCTNCRIKRKTTPYEQKVFKLALKKDVTELFDANHKGCPHCNKGYRGRIAVQEVLEIDDDIRNLLNNVSINKETLKQAVYGSGNVITLLQDGLQKVLGGFTSFEEIYRIIEIDNDINDSCYTSLNKAMSHEQLVEIDKQRTKELNELKKLENMSATKISTGAQSIVETKITPTGSSETIIPNKQAPIINTKVTLNNNKQPSPPVTPPVNNNINETKPQAIPEKTPQNNIMPIIPQTKGQIQKPEPQATVPVASSQPVSSGASNNIAPPKTVINEGKNINPTTPQIVNTKTVAMNNTTPKSSNAPLQPLKPIITNKNA